MSDSVLSVAEYLNTLVDNCEQLLYAYALDYKKTFGENVELFLDVDDTYEINEAAFWNINAYSKLL